MDEEELHNMRREIANLNRLVHFILNHLEIDFLRFNSEQTTAVWHANNDGYEEPFIKELQ